MRRRLVIASLLLACATVAHGQPGAALLDERAAVPMGNPRIWITPNDFPSSALRNLHQGSVRVRLGVDPDGRVTSCLIDKSSGFSELDTATCTLATERARFVPNPEGGSSFVWGYSWVLPGTQSAPATTPKTGI